MAVVIKKSTFALIGVLIVVIVAIVGTIVTVVLLNGSSSTTTKSKAATGTVDATATRAASLIADTVKNSVSKTLTVCSGNVCYGGEKYCTAGGGCTSDASLDTPSVKGTADVKFCNSNACVNGENYCDQSGNGCLATLPQTNSYYCGPNRCGASSTNVKFCTDNDTCTFATKQCQGSACQGNETKCNAATPTQCVADSTVTTTVASTTAPVITTEVPITTTLVQPTEIVITTTPPAETTAPITTTTIPSTTKPTLNLSLTYTVDPPVVNLKKGEFARVTFNGTAHVSATGAPVASLLNSSSSKILCSYLSPKGGPYLSTVIGISDDKTFSFFTQVAFDEQYIIFTCVINPVVIDPANTNTNTNTDLSYQTTVNINQVISSVDTGNTGQSTKTVVLADTSTQVTNAGGKSCTTPTCTLNISQTSVLGVSTKSKVLGATAITVTVTPDANGNWTYTVPQGFDPGTYSVTVKDQSGNTLETTTFTVVAKSSLPNTGVFDEIYLPIFIAFIAIALGFLTYKNLSGRKKIVN